MMSAKNFSLRAMREKTPAGPLGLHGFGVFDEADRGRELRILKGGGEARDGLRVREVHGQAEDFLREMIDALRAGCSRR